MKACEIKRGMTIRAEVGDYGHLMCIKVKQVTQDRNYVNVKGTTARGEESVWFMKSEAVETV